jgi:hypothetical protein
VNVPTQNVHLSTRHMFCVSCKFFFVGAVFAHCQDSRDENLPFRQALTSNSYSLRMLQSAMLMIGVVGEENIFVTPTVYVSLNQVL